MTEEPRHTTAPGGSSPASLVSPDASPGATRPRTNWAATLSALAAGLLLGAGGMWMLGQGGDGSPVADGVAAPTATQTPDPQAPVIEQVTVPQSCTAIADEAEQLNGVLIEGVGAVRDLDASVLSSVVRDFGARQERIQRLSEECRRGMRTARTAPPTSPATASDEPTGSATSE